MKTSTRRGFLGATVTLPIAAYANAPQTSPTVAHPDAELIALAERFITGEIAVQDWPPGADGDLPEPEFSQAVSAQDALASEMGALRATTVDGVAARARCLAAHNSGFDFSMDDPDTATGRLVHYLMRDAAALGGSPPSTVRRPDAAIVEAASAFNALQARSDATWIGVVTDEDRDAGEPERERLYSEQEPFVDVLCDTPAHTLAGHRARAQALVAFFPDIVRRPSGYDGHLLASLLRDLTDGGAEV